MDINLEKLKADLESGKSNSAFIRKRAKFYRKLENRGVSIAYLLKDIRQTEHRFVVHAISMKGTIDSETIALLKQRIEFIPQITIQQSGYSPTRFGVSYYNKNGIYESRHEMSLFDRMCVNLPGVIIRVRRVMFDGSQESFPLLDSSAAIFGYGRNLPIIGLKGMQICLIPDAELQNGYEL